MLATVGEDRALVCGPRLLDELEVAGGALDRPDPTFSLEERVFGTEDFPESYPNP